MSEVIRVCELAEQLRGVSYGKSDASSTPRPGYLPVLRAGNITEDGLTFDDLVFVPAERISVKQKIRRNDVVIAASSGSLDVVGKAARALDDYEGGFGAFCKVLRPGPDVDPAYFAHFFSTQQYRQRMSALAAGVNINNLRNEHLDEIRIPIPALSEQRRLAEILDAAQALRAKRHEALAKLDTLTQSIFLDMFGDPATNPKGWPISRVGAVAKQIRGVTYSKGEASKEPKAGFLPILRAGNIAAGDIVMDDLVFVPAERVAEEQLLQSNDVLIATSSGSLDVVGKAARVQDDMPVGFGAFCKVLRPGSEVDQTFFAAFFSTQYYHRRVSELAAGININNLRIEHLDNFQLPKPPRDLQRSFATVVAATIACRASNRGSLSLLNALFPSLQNRAFRGEL